MAVKRQCDRCKEYFNPDEVQQLDYWSQGIGHYFTVHLCKAKCDKAFDKEFMKGKAVKPL